MIRPEQPVVNPSQKEPQEEVHPLLREDQEARRQDQVHLVKKVEGGG